MAVITQRESGWWQAKVRRQGWPNQSKTHRTKIEAEAWARQIESSFDRGILATSTQIGKTTFGAIANKFATEFAPFHYRGEAWKTKLAHLVRSLGAYSLTALSAECIASYRDARLVEPDARFKDSTNAPRVSNSTVKGELDVLSKIFDVAQKEFGLILPIGNPVLAVRKPSEPESRDYRLSPAEWDELLLQCHKSKCLCLASAVLLALDTSMRQGELRGLIWADVDVNKQVAILRVQIGGSKLKQKRAVPLSMSAVTTLKKLQKSPTDRVIPLSRQSLYGAFKTACRRAGVPNYRWHDIRHEALSRLAERGDLSVIEMAAISGHKTLQTLSRYVHLQASQLALKLG